jgi:hypothetical protein
VKIKLIFGARESGGIGDFWVVGCLLSGYGWHCFHHFFLYENIGVSGDVCLMAWESGTYSEVFGVKDLLVSS